MLLVNMHPIKQFFTESEIWHKDILATFTAADFCNCLLKMVVQDYIMKLAYISFDQDTSIPWWESTWKSVAIGTSRIITIWSNWNRPNGARSISLCQFQTEYRSLTWSWFMTTNLLTFLCLHHQNTMDLSLDQLTQQYSWIGSCSYDVMLLQFLIVS